MQTTEYLKYKYLIPSKKNQLLFIIILIALSIGYFFKIQSLPTSNLKYIFSIAYGTYLILLPFSKKTKHIEWILFSFIIFFMESVSNTNIPKLIYLSESGIKIIAPLVFYIYLNYKSISLKLVKTGIFLTFVAHGLLAINIINTPESFYIMTIKILNFNTSQTASFLYIVGVFDIIAAILLISNCKHAFRIAIYYCIIWGFITALARTVYLLDTSFSTILLKGIPETIIRLPNSLLPILLLHINKKV